MVVVSLYFDKNIVGIYDISKATCLWVFFIVILSLWTCLWVLKWRVEYFKNPLNLPIFIWLLVNILSTIFSDAPIVSFLGFYKRYEGLLTMLSYIIISFAIINFFDLEYLKRFIKIIVIIGVISGIYAIFQYTGCDFFLPGKGGRWEGYLLYGKSHFCCFIFNYDILSSPFFLFLLQRFPFISISFSLIYYLLIIFYGTKQGSIFGLSFFIPHFYYYIFLFYRRQSKENIKKIFNKLYNYRDNNNYFKCFFKFNHREIF